MVREEKQKAINALKISAPVMAVTQEEFNDYIQTLNKIMDWLEQESRWIPVSERLPRGNGWYRCTVIVNDLPRTMELFYKNDKWLDNRRIDMFNTYDIYGFGYTKEKHKLSYQELISEFDWTETVTAWMPLPKPYEGATGK